MYRIASNYSWSHINAWCRLVAGGNNIVTKLMLGLELTLALLWVQHNNYIYMVLLSLFLSSSQ